MQASRSGPWHRLFQRQHHPTDTTPLPPNRALRYRPCMDQLSALNFDITHLACTSCIDASMLSVHDGLRLGPRKAEVVTPLQKKFLDL